MRYLTLTLLSIFFYSSSQALYIKGFVYDNANAPLEAAKVKLRMGTKLSSETESSNTGSFILSFQKGKSYVLWVEKDGFEPYSIMIDGNREDIPLLEIRLKKIQPGMYGTLVANKKKQPIPFQEIICENTNTSEGIKLMTDSEGKFYTSLEPNTGYRFTFRDTEGKYEEAFINISTVGTSSNAKIRKEMVAKVISIDLEEDEVVNIDPAELSKNPDVAIDKDEDVILKQDDSTYVSNKHVPLISFSKRGQKQREEELETIYFYAQLLPDDLDPEMDPVLAEEKVRMKESSKPSSTYVVVEGTETGKMKEKNEASESISSEGHTPDILYPSRNSVYFAKGKSFLTDEAREYLQKYADQLIANPKMQMTLSSHTDADVEYSIEKELSRLRAEAVMTFFLDHGVKFDQLTIRAIGNSQPVNRCKYGVECSENEHKRNRRVELILENNKPY